jgi:hypothetical protein
MPAARKAKRLAMTRNRDLLKLVRIGFPGYFISRNILATRQFCENKQKRKLSRLHGRIETRFCAALGFDTPPLGALSQQAAKYVR